MARFFKKRDQSRGLSPGALIFIGKQKVDEVRIRLIDYDPKALKEDELQDIAQGEPFKHTRTVTWINVDGLHDLDTIKKIGATFELHPLLLEDLLNTGQRPKLEEFDNCLFLVVKMLRYDKEKQMILAEQLSMVIGDTFLLTFQEQPGDVFEPVRERIRKGKGRIRGASIDYLAYALLDTVVDNYIFIIETMGEKIEDLEDAVLSNPVAATMERIGEFKREMNYLRRSIRPAREAIVQLCKLDSELINAQTSPFLKDLLDLITQATEAIDTYQEMLADQLDLYNSAVGNRMNDIMKVPDHICGHFHPLNIYCRYLRHQFRIRARTSLSVQLFYLLGRHDCGGDFHADFFQKKELVVGTPTVRAGVTP